MLLTISNALWRRWRSTHSTHTAALIHFVVWFLLLLVVVCFACVREYVVIIYVAALKETVGDLALFSVFFSIIFSFALFPATVAAYLRFVRASETETRSGKSISKSATSSPQSQRQRQQ